MGNRLQATQTRLTKTLLDLNRPRDAQQTLQAAREFAQLNPIQAIAHTYLEGEVLARLKRQTEARRTFRQSLQRLQTLVSMRNIPPEEVGFYLGQFREQAATIASHYARWNDWRGAFEACQRGKGNALRLAWQAPLLPRIRPTEQKRLDALRTRYEDAQRKLDRARTPVGNAACPRSRASSHCWRATPDCAGGSPNP